MRPESATAIHLEDYRPAPYRISTVDLDIKLFAKATLVTARLAVHAHKDTAPGTPLVLQGDELDLSGLLLDGLPLLQDAYTATPDQLTIHEPPSDPFILHIETRLNPDENTQLMGLYRTSGTYCTQCEAEGFRRITYFLDRPDILSVYTTRIEARKSEAPVLLGNGNLAEAGDIPGTDRHFAVWYDPHPKPSYLFAMVAGDLAYVADTFTTASGRKVALTIYVEHGREDKCAWAMDSLKRAMAWDEKVFGCEYDLGVFNIVAVSDFNMGAMENKGLNIFNDKYILADPEAATDQDYANIEAIVAHEYFHNWTGNRITCRDWFQLCLKEGLTVFRDQEFSSDMRSRAVKRISDIRLLKSHQFPEDAGPLAHPVRPRKYTEINNFYTATVYEKGAEVVRMLKTLLGEKGFKNGMDLYLERHDGEATTIEAFLTCFSEATATDLGQFARWYEQAGTPQVDVKSHYDQTTGELILDIKQSMPILSGQADAEPAVIPLRFGLVGSNGRDIIPTKVTGARVQQGSVLILEEQQQTVTCSGLPERPVLSIGRGFSAPIRLQTHQSMDDLLFLARQDNDPFNRWQALQTLASLDLLRLAADARTGRTLVPASHLIETYGDVLGNNTLDPAFRALALQLPSEADLAQDLGKNVDPDAIANARQALREAIGTAHASALLQAHLTRPEGPFRPDASEAGQRALANQALGFYAASGAGGVDELVSRAFQAAGNMTDRIAALTLLVHNNLEGSEDALAAFRSRHEKNPLALDKWFMVQATAPLADGVERVKALTAHPLFDYRNANRMRSLIQSFATGNPTQFARKDGSGFALVADYVLIIDQRNPQVASRLLTCFRSWRALEASRSQKAEVALQRISAAENLSRDCRDIVERSLG